MLTFGCEDRVKTKGVGSQKINFSEGQDSRTVFTLIMVLDHSVVK